MTDEQLAEIEALAEQSETMPDLFAADLHDVVLTLIAALREAQGEKLEAQFRPGLGDNHHNGAMCPYCMPAYQKWTTEERELRAELATAEERILKVGDTANEALNLYRRERAKNERLRAALEKIPGMNCYHGCAEIASAALVREEKT